jgi:hypothetical protein
MSASFLSYDTARSAVVVVGLRHSDDQWKLAHIEFANGAWGEMELHEGTAPAAYHHGQALLFARDRGTLMYVKQDGLRAWSGAQARPHLGVSFDLSGPAQVLPSVSDPIPRELLSVGLSVSAGGRAHALGTGTGNGEVFDGYQVYLMGQSAAGATLLHENQNAGPEVPEDWSGTFAADWVESQGIYLTPALSDWLDRHGRLQLLVTTRAAQGSSSAPARIELDYVEVDVVYNRGPAGEPGTPCLDEAGYFEDGRWCDDGDPATAFSMCRGGQCLGFGAP